MGNKSSSSTTQTTTKTTSSSNEELNLNNKKKEKFILLSKYFKYIYSERNCTYRSEQLEISPDEHTIIKQLIEQSQHKLNNNNNATTTTTTTNSSFSTTTTTTSDLIINLKNPWYEQILKIANNKPVKIILDTDIGTDIDDVLTILTLLHMSTSDVECVGITTNYHPTLLRKYIVESILKAFGNNENNSQEMRNYVNSIPIYAGSSYVCGTHREYFHAGNEGLGLHLSTEEIVKLWEISDDKQILECVDFIYNTCVKFPKQITIVSIGIPTNLGLTITKYGEKFEEVCGHIVVMGGGSILGKHAQKYDAIGVWSNQPEEWRYKNTRKQEEMSKIIHQYELPDNEIQGLNWCDNIITLQKNKEITNVNVKPIHFFPNHNISGDTLASQILFNLRKCPISVIPHHVTSKHWLKGRAIETLLNLSVKSDELFKTSQNKNKDIWMEGENGICGCLMREWFRVRHGQRGQCLHDPLTLYEAVYPVRMDSLSVKNENDYKDDEKMNEDNNNSISNSKKIQNDKKQLTFKKGESSLEYIPGTFVCHEWAAFLTFIPDINGPHRLAAHCINPEQFIAWCAETLINNVSEKNITNNAGPYEIIMKGQN